MLNNEPRTLNVLNPPRPEQALSKDERSSGVVGHAKGRSIVGPRGTSLVCYIATCTACTASFTVEGFSRTQNSGQGVGAAGLIPLQDHAFNSLVSSVHAGSPAPSWCPATRRVYCDPMPFTSLLTLAMNRFHEGSSPKPKTGPRRTCKKLCCWGRKSESAVLDAGIADQENCFEVS